MNVQHKLSVMRPPRVHITHDVETVGSLEKRELPFVVGVIADLAGDSPLQEMHDRRFVFIDGQNFDAVMAFINPTITLNVAGEELRLTFNKFQDFSPDLLIQRLPSLEALLKKRVALTDLAGKLDGNVKLETELAKTIRGEASEAKESLRIADEERATFVLATFTESVGDQKEIENIYQFIVGQIALLDQQLSEGMSGMLHHPKFQKLESAWRGLYHLVSHAACSSRLRVRVLSASRKDLESDLYKSPSFDLSNLFKKIYEEEYGTPGGSPYSCIVVDLYFGNSNKDVELLRKLSEVGSAAHAPIITSAGPQMFGLDNFKDLCRVNDISKIFEGSEAVKFKGLRDTEESRYLALTLARVLGRAPYDPERNPIESFAFKERVAADTDLCWMNAAYCLGERIVNAYTLYGWTAAIRGVEGGGLIENLPQHLFKTDQGDLIMQCPTEVAPTDRQERELSDLGFLALCHIKNTDKAVIFGAQTVQKSKLYISKDATANSTVAARLPYIINASRFAHYIKVMMRDKIGSSMSAAEVERYLQDWLADYVLLSENASLETKAEIPLKAAQVKVTEDEERPGSYKAVIHLQPHFQMEDLTTSIRLVAKLPSLEAA